MGPELNSENFILINSLEYPQSDAKYRKGILCSAKI
jgi:hypothetical protein